MATLLYKIIKSKTQYYQYCHWLEELVMQQTKNKTIREEIELLTLLIEKWDEEHNHFQKLNPIQLLQSLMTENEMKSKDLVALLSVSKGYVSEILNYKKGLSKENIRKLSAHFKVSQEAFNREYALRISETVRVKNVRKDRVMG